MIKKMKLETLVKTRNAYQKRLEDEKLFISLCNQIGKQNATANKKWMKRKVRDLDKEIEEYEQKSITDC